MLRTVLAALVVSFLMSAVSGTEVISAQAAGAQARPRAAETCTAEEGQLLIDAGSYDRAIREFTCLIDAQPTEVEGYRGRIEAELLSGLYSDAVRDYARVTAYVEPVHPDVQSTILNEYAARLSASPDNVPALTGASFARWWFFDYAGAIKVLNHLLEVRPDDLYGTLFRGSSAVLRGNTHGTEYLERALTLAPDSPDVRYVVADGYLYGQSDYVRALSEASLALDWGLDTPRVHAILASANLSLGHVAEAAAHFAEHIDLVTTEFVPTAPLTAGSTLTGDLVPGRTLEVPVPAVAGQTLAIATSSHDFYDTIAVLLDPDGTPVTGGDDYKQYFAGFEYTAQVTGTYVLWATSFEGVNTGQLVVTRK